MNSTVAAVLATDLATMARVADVPSEDLRYGRDLSCVSDLAPDYSDVEPDSVRATGEALIRRALTPRGGLLDDPDYGLDVRGMLHGGVHAARLRTLGGQLTSEFRKDDRVDDATVSVATDDTMRTLRVAARITPADPDRATFDMVFAVSDSDALIDTISEAGV